MLSEELNRLHTILYMIPEKVKPQGQETDQWLPGMRGWQQRGAREFLELKEQFYKLFVMLITSLYVFVKNQRTEKKNQRTIHQEG